MKTVSIHQASVWSHKIMTEATNKRQEKNDNFDAMLFIESKDVRNILPVIVSSLNARYEAGAEEISNKSHYSDAITCLLKTMRQTYGEADNPIMNSIKEKGHDKLQSDFERLNDMANRMSAESRERSNENAMSKLGA